MRPVTPRPKDNEMSTTRASGSKLARVKTAGPATQRSRPKVPRNSAR
jgi:hypothetical protein